MSRSVAAAPPWAVTSVRARESATGFRRWVGPQGLHLGARGRGRTGVRGEHGEGALALHEVPVGALAGEA